MKKNEERLELDDNTRVSDLQQQLTSGHGALGSIKFRIAVNRELCMEDMRLNENDEVALLPPFSGG